MKSTTRVCVICGKSFVAREVVRGSAVRPAVAATIQREHPEWSGTTFICRTDLERYRGAYVQSILEHEKGDLTSLEQEVLESLRQHDLLTTNLDEDIEQSWSFGERLADRIAAFGGSWRFITIFGLLLITWIVLNTTVLYAQPVDPYPFILLNLILSCIAAVQAPLIMMSQRRQEAKDRTRSRHDYQINLKAELEVRHLNEKVDHLLSSQWERLVEIQELQLELLSEIGRR